MPDRNQAAGDRRAFQENLRLSELEYRERRLYLYSRPRCLSLVLGNSCNIDCLHCYQSHSGEALLHPPAIGAELRRELAAFYPYLSTLRLQGGEVFALPGFSELVEEAAAAASRPILSVSTNGTLIDDRWAERLVRTPFASVTFSIDGATSATFNRLRRGADLGEVLEAVGRVTRWKKRLASALPHLDAFFVVMRSNFREIPAYLELMDRHGMMDVTLQTLELSDANTRRTPALEASQSITARGETAELHAILAEALPRFRRRFRVLRTSGLRGLFEAHGLDAAFLEEESRGLYPDSDGLSAGGGFELCPNPWTTLFVAENGDARLCFLSQPVGNLYGESLSALWNSPRAVAKRRDMIDGRYLGSGCSERYCAWREGRAAPAGGAPQRDARLDLAALRGEAGEEPGEVLALVRRIVSAEQRKRRELDAEVFELQAQAEAARRHIDALEAKAAKAVNDFHDLHGAFMRYREPFVVRAAHKAARWLDRLWNRPC
jgi:MoaA/NifB/PqqE/SkfB family radical SAM enzyme